MVPQPHCQLGPLWLLTPNGLNRTGGARKGWGLRGHGAMGTLVEPEPGAGGWGGVGRPWGLWVGGSEKGPREGR